MKLLSTFFAMMLISVSSFATVHLCYVSSTNHTNGSLVNSRYAMPLQFIYLSVSKYADNHLIKWTAAEGTAADYYLVERSENTKEWKEVAVLMAAENHGNTFMYKDKVAASAKGYYRIKLVDVNGNIAYSAYKTTEAQPPAFDFFVAAATENSICIQLSKAVKSSLVVQVSTLSGELILTEVVENNASQFRINKTGIAKGVYVVSVIRKNGSRKDKQISI